MHRNIICAVNIHRKAINDCCDLLESQYLPSEFYPVLKKRILNEYPEVLSLRENVENFFLHFMYVISIFTYLFLANYIGQEIIDHNNPIFVTAYNVRWYAAPIHIQKLILFLLQRNKKIFGLNVGGLFTASLECFSTLSSASMSYFTLLHSTQQQN
ncbi:odorant receptor 4-like [Odontomachus brunneus]|uniref:odorant receptor 4-like n=1 Tax=Odontomachus brunneus TaxID=486640 RepID=UPI0013F1867F|nr:odorant receptor 4-like [Odontomachus brunneus]